MNDVRGRPLPVNPADGEARVGQLIDDRYRIIEPIAEGGTARVYTAHDLRMPRTVAIKIARSRHAPAPMPVIFRQEATAAARLRHPNVVGVFDSGEFAGRPYIVMEYVPGPTVRDILNTRTRLPVRQALRWCRELLVALAVAHRARLVHCDVKPENILLHRSAGHEHLKLTDFGLARPIGTSTSDQTGPVLATVAYLAPELAAGEPVDARTDLYSVGVVLFELLTGEVPFDDDDPQTVMRMHLDHPVPPPSRLVPELAGTVSDLVVTATRRRPGDRFADATTFVAAIDVVLRCLERPVVPVPAGAPRQRSAARPDHTATTAPPKGSRRRTALFTVVVVMALLLAGGWWWMDGRYRPAPQLVGDHLATVDEDAARLSLRVAFTVRRFSRTAAPGTVLAQSPAPGTPMLPGDTVTVTLSQGSGAIRVPALIGHGRDHAAEVLATRPVRVRFVDTVDPAPAGTVVGVDPPAGTVVPPAGTVTVAVSVHPEDVVVPSVVGRSWSQAVELLDRAGITPRRVTGSSGTGRVTGQDLLPGSSVAPGTVMTVTTGSAPQRDR